MVREEPGEGSSSPNVNPITITALRKRGTREETLGVSLSEGSSFFIPSEWACRFAAGTAVDEEALEEIRRADAYIRCKEWAAPFLAAKEESSGRLLQKMAARGYDRETGKAVLRELQALGFQDDARFAEQWLRSRMRKHPEAPGHLEAGLIRRGVEAAIAREAVAEAAGPEELRDMLRRCIDKFLPAGSSGEPSEKGVRRIMRRGFSYGAIKRNLTHDNDY